MNIEAGVPIGRQIIAAAWQEVIEAWGASVERVKLKKWSQSVALGEAESCAAKLQGTLPEISVSSREFLDLTMPKFSSAKLTQHLL